MMSEARARRICLKEAEAEMARREKENENFCAAQALAKRKEEAYGKLQQLREKREKFLQTALELDKTNPDAARMMLSQGEVIDSQIRQLEEASAYAESLTYGNSINEALDEAYKIISELCTQPIRFRNQKELAEIERKTKLNSVMRELSDEARKKEWSIYTRGVTPTVGSTFTADFEARKRAALIENIDD